MCDEFQSSIEIVKGKQTNIPRRCDAKKGHREERQCSAPKTVTERQLMIRVNMFQDLAANLAKCEHHKRKRVKNQETKGSKANKRAQVASLLPPPPTLSPFVLDHSPIASPASFADQEPTSSRTENTLSQSSFFSLHQQAQSPPVSQRAITYSARNEINNFRFAEPSEKEEEQQQFLGPPSHQFRHSSASIDHKSLQFGKFDHLNRHLECNRNPDNRGGDAEEDEAELYRKHLSLIQPNSCEQHATEVIYAARRSSSFHKAIEAGQQPAPNSLCIGHYPIASNHSLARHSLAGRPYTRPPITRRLSATPAPKPPQPPTASGPAGVYQTPTTTTTMSLCDELAIRTSGQRLQQVRPISHLQVIESDSLDNIQMIVDEEASVQQIPPVDQYDMSTIRPVQLAPRDQLRSESARANEGAASGAVPRASIVECSEAAGERQISMTIQQSTSVGTTSDSNGERKQAERILENVEHVVQFDDLTNSTNSDSNRRARDELVRTKRRASGQPPSRGSTESSQEAHRTATAARQQRNGMRFADSVVYAHEMSEYTMIRRFRNSTVFFFFFFFHRLSVSQRKQ